jgi:hypothetical protein
MSSFAAQVRQIAQPFPKKDGKRGLKRISGGGHSV